MFNTDVHAPQVEDIPEEDPSPKQASTVEENADSPGLAEVIESVKLLRKKLSEVLKDIHEKLDAQDKRIIVVEAFVNNTQDSVPDMDDEWRCNDVGYDFSFDRAEKYQEGADTTGKGAGSVGKEAEASK
ncbi:unnamed protein product [Arabis nemorensis]|uniref:Uncharacterized protein n=1 Tax=Arabis nemorensis TaxID=586526 RepID=A0A565AT45_9BRAS|nr:unnamed protein product [Arabis nemorensis]